MLLAANAGVWVNAQSLVASRSRLDTLKFGKAVDRFPIQNNATVDALSPGKQVQSQIKGDETQILTLALQNEQYAQVAFEWQNLDLDVQVLKPSGIPLARSEERRVGKECRS